VLTLCLNQRKHCLGSTHACNCTFRRRVLFQPTAAAKDAHLCDVNMPAGDLLMVLCVTMAAAVLAASFVVFLVREAESRSKHVQVRGHAVREDGKRHVCMGCRHCS
jgi:hypothetical protein